MAYRFRLWSGLVLLTYVASHLLNHALGIFTVDLAEAGRGWFTGFWRLPPATALLYGALACHLALVLGALYRRRHLRIPRWELLRLALGLLIPLQLIPHAFGTRLQHELFGVEDSYTRQVLTYWLVDPGAGQRQIALLIVAWLHGCLGFYFWLRLQPGRAVTLPATLVVGVTLPLLALAGYVDMGLHLAELADQPGQLVRLAQPLAPADAAWHNFWRERTLWLYGLLVGGVFLAREVRRLWLRRRGGPRLTYPGGRQVPVPPGATVLEASRWAGIPHASLCGGRGRCSTCRIRVDPLGGPLPAPAALEARVLRRVGAPPNVRLACQVRPTADLRVFPLFSVAGRPGGGREAAEPGREREIAILFADLRSFTRFAEHRLPYDVVFVLNEYFAAMGAAVERSGGRVDKFIGDGVMALFGIEGGAAQGCRQALKAAREIADRMEEFNRTLAQDLDRPLRIGIGIHTGPAIVGEMGFGRATSLTAIGDAVNTASRLEQLTKEFDAEVVISEDVVRKAGIDLSACPGQDTSIRGRRGAIAIRVVAKASDLPSLD